MKLQKTITWALIAFSITTGVGWFITGSLVKGGLVGIICRVIKLPAYWLHETAYEKKAERTAA